MANFFNIMTRFVRSKTSAFQGLIFFLGIILICELNRVALKVNNKLYNDNKITAMIKIIIK